MKYQGFGLAGLVIDLTSWYVRHDESLAA